MRMFVESIIYFSCPYCRRVLKERLSHLLFAEKTEIYQTHAKGRWAERVQEHREHVIQLKWQQEVNHELIYTQTKTNI
jgi:hypothetical protein